MRKAPYRLRHWWLVTRARLSIKAGKLALWLLPDKDE